MPKDHVSFCSQRAQTIHLLAQVLYAKLSYPSAAASLLLHPKDKYLHCGRANKRVASNLVDAKRTGLCLVNR